MDEPFPGFDLHAPPGSTFQSQGLAVSKVAVNTASSVRLGEPKFLHRRGVHRSRFLSLVGSTQVHVVKGQVAPIAGDDRDMETTFLGRRAGIDTMAQDGSPW